MAKGFNRPAGGGMKGGGMVQQIKKMQEQMEIIQTQLADETVTSSSGGGVVKVTMTGAQHCNSVFIDLDFFQEGDVEMLQDLIISAVNLALDQSRQLQSDRMGPLAGGLSGLGF